MLYCVHFYSVFTALITILIAIIESRVNVTSGCVEREKEHGVLIFLLSISKLILVIHVYHKHHIVVNVFNL